MSFSTFEYPSWLLDRDEKVTGGVLEFMFGPTAQSYYATSYPYKTRYADKHDVRLDACHLLPTTLEAGLSELKGCYIMNVAVNRQGAYFIYFSGNDARISNRVGGSNLPGPPQHKWLQDYDNMRRENDISSISFGETDDIYFIRATSPVKHEWIYDWSSAVSWLCDKAIKKRQNAAIRSCTFGPDNGWVLYGKDWHEWDGLVLPKTLKDALEEGKNKKWTINKVVLNPRNSREYFLAYNNGNVYYAFHKDVFAKEFHKQFLKVLNEWMDKKNKATSEKYKLELHPEPLDEEAFELAASTTPAAESPGHANGQNYGTAGGAIGYNFTNATPAQAPPPNGAPRTDNNAGGAAHMNGKPVGSGPPPVSSSQLEGGRGERTRSRGFSLTRLFGTSDKRKAT